MGKGKIDHGSSVRPPRGVVPRTIHDKSRASELIDAMGRYNDVSKPIPQSWVEELSEINKRYVKDEP